MNGAQALFKALTDAGVTTCFANPGTSEMQLVYEIGLTANVRPILCLQEDVVTGAADGYARMKGSPAVTLLHVGSGFANGIAMLHNAGRANTPVINVVGANASYHQPNYPEHELINGRVIDLARVVSHWTREARSASELGELGAEATVLAKAGKICTIVAPTNFHWEEAAPPPIPAALHRPMASPDAITHAANMLANGKKTGLVLGNLALRGDPLEIAGRIAAKTNAELLSETFPSFSLARGEGRPIVEIIPYFLETGLEFLKDFEQLIFVGALSPVVTFAYRNKPTLKSEPRCALFTMASADQDLLAALESLAKATGSTAAETMRRTRRSTAVPTGELTAEAIGQTLCALMPENAILVDEAATNGSKIFAATEGARSHDFLSPVNGGAIGGGLPMALGAAIACPDRKIILVQADGSGMYTVQALWSMAREKADIVAIILKNDAYAVLGLEMARVREGELNAKMESMLDLKNPALDWVNIALGLGVSASRAKTAADFYGVFASALETKGPTLIECQVAIPNELAAFAEFINKSR
ncbi:acetolactate synthase large subunit [Bradyrhizobium lablabi]|uniref:acetolactate synthase large subunit n=1 Tax=Bradyrhizobium lablabi TaxID=722472 RepID=UPI001BA6EE4B|nr:acetolactate synthase large subunit [Bradyrhizobium lablabi]MBR0696342.1 acetolactate synthase large subunit [Bradyrhizobium lablabi]